MLIVLDLYVYLAASQEMSEANFAVTADPGEISRMQCELDYTEGISQQMRIPDRLKVGPDLSMDQPPPFPEESHSTMMHVPDRIVVAGTSAHCQLGITALNRESVLIPRIPLSLYKPNRTVLKYDESFTEESYSSGIIESEIHAALD